MSWGRKEVLQSSRRTHANFDQRCTWQSVQNHNPEPEILASNVLPSKLNVFLKQRRETDCCDCSRFAFQFHLDILIDNVDQRDCGPGKEIRDCFCYPCNSPLTFLFLSVACSFLPFNPKCYFSILINTFLQDIPMSGRHKVSRTYSNLKMTVQITSLLMDYWAL